LLQLHRTEGEWYGIGPAADDESTSPRVIWNILARVQVIKPTEMRHLFVSHTHRSPISLSNMFILHARRRRIVAEKRGEKRDLKTRLQLRRKY